MGVSSNIASLRRDALEPSKSLLVRTSELVLKGKNRYSFEAQLLKNIHRSVGGELAYTHKKVRASHLLEFEDVPSPALMGRLQKIFGIAYLAPVYVAELDVESLVRDLLQRLPNEGVASFAVRTRRLNRNFPYNSPELNAALGAEIQKARGWPVDLDVPDLAINIEVLDDVIYWHWQRYQGPRGLPVGVSGKVIALLSGGIDSPVAAFQLASRGCLPVYVHFHSAPYTSRASIEKAIEVVEQLEKYHYQTRLYLVPLAPIQKEIVTRCPERLRVILYRRFMIRIAERIARNEKAQALVTGESVGQVASQTLSNMRTIESVTLLPILRPLVGTDKQDIVERAREIGTYELSIQPDQDCCSYLMPRRPVTHSRISDLEAAEQELDIESLVLAAFQETEKRSGKNSAFPFRRNRVSPEPEGADDD